MSQTDERRARILTMLVRAGANVDARAKDGCTALFGIWSVVMIQRFGLKPMHFPQWVLFAPIAVCGALGLVT